VFFAPHKFIGCDHRPPGNPEAKTIDTTAPDPVANLKPESKKKT
jgi:hypothetical protein